MVHGERQMGEGFDFHGRREFEPAALLAEQTVARFFSERFPDASTRFSTLREDHGMDEINRGQAIDLVVYIRETPAMAVQVTELT